LLARLRARFGLAPLMSGSGSACFALLPDDAPVAAIAACIREAWGPVCFVQAAAIA
jgi:4-diphosphocytidyl-2-C-methyl-D-erythritol kinase